MMMLGGWMATIPELPVKTGLGKVIWETAQAADVLGNRLPELRCGKKAVEASQSSNDAFAEFITSLAEPERPDLTIRSEEHTSELQSRRNLVCRLLLEKKKHKCSH